jgi:hypothetical protein
LGFIVFMLAQQRFAHNRRRSRRQGFDCTLGYGFSFQPDQPMSDERVERRLAAILAADVAGYSPQGRLARGVRPLSTRSGRARQCSFSLGDQPAHDFGHGQNFSDPSGGLTRRQQHLVAPARLRHRPDLGP